MLRGPITLGGWFVVRAVRIRFTVVDIISLELCPPGSLRRSWSSHGAPAHRVVCAVREQRVTFRFSVVLVSLGKRRRGKRREGGPAPGPRGHNRVPLCGSCTEPTVPLCLSLYSPLTPPVASFKTPTGIILIVRGLSSLTLYIHTHTHMYIRMPSPRRNNETSAAFTYLLMAGIPCYDSWKSQSYNSVSADYFATVLKFEIERCTLSLIHSSTNNFIKLELSEKKSDSSFSIIFHALISVVSPIFSSISIHAQNLQFNNFLNELNFLFEKWK